MSTTQPRHQLPRSLMVWDHSDCPAKLQRLLDRATELLHGGTDKARQMPDGTLELSCRIPKDQRPTMVRDADRLLARATKHGCIFDISEERDGCSGGYMASTISARLYEAFLVAWIADAAQPRQLDLWGVE